MRVYITRRILLMIPTVFLVTAFIFLLVRLIPGSMVDLIVQEMAGVGEISDLTIERVKERLGLRVRIP